jgi:hypothetical protein
VCVLSVCLVCACTCVSLVLRAYNSAECAYACVLMLLHYQHNYQWD